MHFVAIFLFAASTSFATTFAVRSSNALNAVNALDSVCEVSAKYVDQKNRAVAYSRAGIPATQYWVYWSYEIQSTHSVGGADCPQGNAFDLRIREGSYVLPANGEAENYVYPVHITVPEQNARQELKIKHIVGQDGLTKAALDEWIVQ